MEGDKENIHVCGDSSGGNFAAAVAAMSADRNGPGNTESKSCISSGDKLGRGKEKILWHLRFWKKISAECLALVSLQRSVILLWIRVLCMQQNCRNAGVEVEYHMMKGMIHGFLNWTYRSSFEAMDRIIENVNRWYGKNETFLWIIWLWIERKSPILLSYG